jgi:hypothetical protein
VRFFGIAWCILVSTAFAIQTGSPKDSAGSTVQGKVLQEAGTEPIRKATVQLTGGDGHSTAEYAATTDADGRFRIENVKPGRYTVTIDHSGLVQSGGRRSTIVLLPAQGTTDFVFHMQPAAALTGKIVDVDGDPMSDVSVVAHLVGSTSRGMSPRESFAATSNDLGEFRIASLRAGRYMIEADPPRRPFLEPHPGGNGASNAKDQAIYATTYYPGTLDQEQSVAIEIHAGDETPVNFGLQRSRVYRVSGTVLAVPGGGRPLMIMLRPKGSDLHNYANGGPQIFRVGEGGNFEFPSLLPGSYTARLDIIDLHVGGLPGIRMARVSQAIEVSDRDVEGLELQPDVGGPVRGKLRMDTGQKFDWTRLEVYFMPIDYSEVMEFSSPGEMPPRVSQDGTFEAKNVPGGNYRFGVGSSSNTLPDVFTKSVNLAGRDVTDSGFSVSPGMFLDVVISANGGTIDGTVEDGKGKPVAYAEVVDAPNAERRARWDLYKQVTTDERGHFSLRGLNPGKYTVMAFEELPEGDIRWPNFLTPYESQGQEIELDEGARRSVVLKVIPAAVD